MQQTLLLLILMGSIVSSHRIQYHFVKNSMSWSEAQSYCREMYTDLATVSDMEDVKKLHNETQTLCAWIGLYNKTDTKEFVWRWSQPGVDYNDSQKNWFKSEPNNFDNKERCVVVKKESQQWADISCEDAHPFICYNETGPDNFHVIGGKKSWSEAQRHCREHHTDLVSGVDKLNNTKFKEKLTGFTRNTDLFIGLFRDTWLWSDRSSFLFRHWAEYPSPDHPGSCAVTMLDEEGKWKNEDCDSENSFFCLDDNMILINMNMSWDKALEYCREHHNDLVSIITPEDQKWVQERAKEATSSHVWLGLRYIHILEFWFWVSNEAVEYENWVPDGGVEDQDVSGAMERGGEHKWFKKDDEEEFNFICSKK